MKHTCISSDNAVFVVLSFEGPDRYSLAGGLGVRATNLSRVLASSGFVTHLFFVGDPNLKGEEVSNGGKLILHRWCQWISRYHPTGVYQGENEKLNDFNESAPGWITEHIVKPAVADNKMVFILGEEWHTSEAMCRISDQLHAAGLRDRVVLFWNANNVFSFDRINWGRLAYTTTITTVSRYMKHIMWKMGLNPLVIPNGIPQSLLDKVDERAVARLRRHLESRLVLSKVARWDPDKRWNMAVEAVAGLEAVGTSTTLICRGGLEPHGEEVMYNARTLGLTVRDAYSRGDSMEDYFSAIETAFQNDGAPHILNLTFPCPQSFLRILYRASDAVLANSGHEPFGLVGLEAMAAEGIAFVGGTGEDYAIPFYNSIILETSDPKEIVDYMVYLQDNPEKAERIRRAARLTARRFTWEEVLGNLVQKLEYQARTQNMLASPPRVCMEDLHLPEIKDTVPEHKSVLAGSLV